MLATRSRLPNGWRPRRKPPAERRGGGTFSSRVNFHSVRPNVEAMPLCDLSFLRNDGTIVATPEAAFAFLKEKENFPKTTAAGGRCRAVPREEERGGGHSLALSQTFTSSRFLPLKIRKFLPSGCPSPISKGVRGSTSAETFWLSSDGEEPKSKQEGRRGRGEKKKKEKASAAVAHQKNKLRTKGTSSGARPKGSSRFACSPLE